MNDSSVRVRKPLALLGAGLSLFAAHAAFGQTAATPEAPKEENALNLEKIVVTGSYIPMAADAPSAPVAIINAAELAKTGTATNLLDMIRKAVPQFTGSSNIGSNNANVGSGSTNGGSQLALRNTTTLVLVNGRRVASAPVGGTGGFVFTDVNLIPPAAVERIEVLKDGASALYGSDAVSGVVNIILKSDYQGAEIGGRYEYADGPGNWATRNAWATFGASNGKTSVTGSFAWTKSDPLYQFERDYSSPIYGTASFAGVFLDAVNFTDFYNLNPSLNAPPMNTDMTLAQLVAAGIYQGPLSQDEVVLLFDLSSKPTILTSNERKSVSLAADHKLTENVSLFGDLLYSETSTFSQLNAQPVSGTVAGSDPRNPTNQSVSVRNRFVDFPRQYYTDTSALRGVFGARGSFFDGYTWETAVNLNEINQNFRNPGLIDTAAYNAAVANGSYNPFARVQAPGVLSGIIGTSYGDYKSTLESWDGRVGGNVFALPAGDLGFVVGAEWRNEGLTYKTDRNNALGLWLQGTPNRNFDSGRTVEGVFAEVRVPIFSAAQGIPVLNSLEFSGAVRHEKYSDVEDKPTVPKVAIRWQPFNDELTIRASYSESFNAPTLYNLSGPVAEGFTSSFALEKADGTMTGNRQYRSRSGSNTALAPSESRNWTVGVVYSPRAIKGLSLEVDYFNIDERNLISTIGSQTILQDVELLGATSIYADKVRLGTSVAGETHFDDGAPITAPGQVTAGSSDAVWVSDQLVNLAGVWQSGVDVTARYFFNTDSAGRFDFSTSVAYFKEFVFEPLPGQTYDYTGQYTSTFGTLPRWRSFTTFDWTLKDLQLGLTHSFIPSVEDADSGYEEVDSWQSLDLRASYDLGNSRWRWSKGLSFTVGVNNVFDEYAPLIAGEADNGADVGTYGAHGRMYYAQMRLKF